MCETERKELLGVTMDNELKFSEDVSSLCLKAGRIENSLS